MIYQFFVLTGRLSTPEYSTTVQTRNNGMTDVLVQQVSNMATYSKTTDSKSPETSSYFSLLGKFFTSRPSRFHGAMDSIYIGLCEELKPNQPTVPSASWNASVDPQSQQQRLRSYSGLSTTSTETSSSSILMFPTFSIPRWTWPEGEIAARPQSPISKPLKPTKKV